MGVHMTLHNWQVVDMDNTKNNVEVNNAYLNKLKGKLFGLLKEREKNREWEKIS